jgi:hypothetical protein
MHPNLPCEALENGVCLELRYDGFSRLVEVHAVGYSAEGNGLMRVWQVRGGSASGERSGWKLMRLDEGYSGHITTEASFAPRRSYKQGDSAMARIISQI